MNIWEILMHTKKISKIYENFHLEHDINNIDSTPSETVIALW